MKRASGAGVVVIAAILAAGTAAVVPTGCSGGPAVSGELKPGGDRSRRLVALAAEEAAAIADADARLARQLNLANQQIGRGWTDDAGETLAATRETLGSEAGAGLGTHARISGWVSASELARRAGDTAGANAAADGAVLALRGVEGEAERCQYVMGLANELYELKGRNPAADLLADAGAWTRQIDDLAERRRALVAFASALFNLDEYERGQEVLRRDDEPTWRSDTLLALSRRWEAKSPERLARDERLMRQHHVVGNVAPTAAAMEAEILPIDEPTYGKRVDFGSVFQDQARSKTE